MSLSRASRGGFADWWWTVDRLAVLAIVSLFGIGLMLAFAASPAASAGPLTAGNFNYAAKQIAFAAVAVLVMCAASSLTPVQVRRAALVIFLVSLIACIAVLVVGTETLGARRWLDLRWITLQPSEFLKPSFAVLVAAILAEREPLPVPKPGLTLVLLVPALAVLLLEPDVGQSFLLVALWGALLFFAGMSLKWIWAIGGGSAGLGMAAYFLFPHVHHRVEQFLHPDQKGYQTGTSLKAFSHGGLFGVGPGAGTVKYHLPDVHSDFIFAVAGEEFGLLLCAVIVLLFCFLAVRLLLRSAASREPFTQLAGAGLAMVVALQAFINMGVAISLLPAKGMTLPFISYGGSSLFAVALTMGFALALIRQRPKLAVRDDEPLIPFLGGRP